MLCGTAHTDRQRCTLANSATAARQQRMRGATARPCQLADERRLLWDQRLARHCSACVLQIIGATNPTAAQPGSVRQKILADWQGGPSASCARHDQYTQQRWCGAALGLASEPNTGDNGVHASAGPLEGLRERMVPRALVPQSTIEYRSSSAFVVAPSPARAKSPAEKTRDRDCANALLFGSSA